GWRGSLWWYTLAIPVLALGVPLGLVLLVLDWRLGAAVASAPLLLIFLFLFMRFRSVTMAFPRWVARWIVIWPYAWGIVKGLFTLIPPEARRG
ncbi:MAG: hypothetical protein WC655_20225, partial [Candidatus Hydrogenedentales bacterium]